MLLRVHFRQLMRPYQSIDLLNVAFENPRSLANAAKQGSSHDQTRTYTTPDRTTGLATWQELRALRPERTWNFVQVNVPYAEFQDHRQHIIDLMVPNNTTMDLSIAQALYFAARGKGILAGSDEEYQTEARVLLSGLGADEQLGGYSRHKKAFARTGSEEGEGGWAGLLQELQMDVDRIGSRNLGRDGKPYSFSIYNHMLKAIA